MPLQEFAQKVHEYEARLRGLEARIDGETVTSATAQRLYLTAFDPLLHDLERLAEAAREGLECEHKLLDTLPVVVLLLDPDARIVTFNRCLVELSGYSVEEVRGQPWFETFLPERDHARARALFGTVAAGRQVVGNTGSIRAKTGSKRAIEWFATALRDADGEVTGILSTGRDITGQRRIQLDFLEAQNRLQTLFEAAIDPIVGIDEHGQILACNPAVERVFGWTKTELMDQNVRVLMGDPYREQHDGYIESYLATGETLAIGRVRKVTARRKCGQVFPVELSVSEVETQGRGALRFVGVIRDISESEELRAKLTHTERLAAIGELAAGIAHEINNPVNTIVNCAQLIKDGDSDPELCDDILHEGKRITTIVRNLLDFARDTDDDFSSVDLGDVVTQSLALVRRRIVKSGVEIVDDIPAELPFVRGRFQQLEQVVLNLVLNARDALLSDAHQKATRTILVKVFERHPAGGQPSICLGVRDNGPGIPKPDLRRVFEPFFTTKKATGGTGLGLSVSLGIIENHGGKLVAESVFGEYTEMQVTLPELSREPE